MNSKMKKAESRPSDALEAPLAGKLRRSSRLSRADSPSKSKSTLSQSHRADPPSTAISSQVYLFFWHTYSPVMYTLYKIDIRQILQPRKASQDLKLRELYPMLTLKTGKYPDCMCCVQLDSKLYFFGGEFNITNPYIDDFVMKELENVKRDVFPPDVYFLDLANYHLYSDTLSGENDKLPFCKPMNSGKAIPQAFVVDRKIYVIGGTIQMNIIDKSKLKDLDLESFAYFEVYDPEVDMWKILPNPPIRDMNTKWVGHAVVEKTALLVAWQRGKECVYFFDLDKHEWKKYASLPFYPGNFSGRIEYVEDTVYGCYGNTIAAIAPLAAAEEEEDEKEEEIEGVPRLLKHHGLHLVSEKMGMDAIFNVPPQLQSLSSLLHLGNRYFCYVKTGMPPQMNGIDDAIEDDKRRFISVAIFQALGKTYKEHATRLFSAKFLQSAHYVVNNPFPSEGFIDGIFYHPFPSEGFVEDLFSPIWNRIGPGSSNGSGSSSSKEQPIQPVAGPPIKRRKRHRRKHFQNQEPCLMRGVYFKNMKWQAAIKVDKKQIHLGTVGSQEEAARLYDRAAFMCGREPNFELSEEEKQELRKFKWDEFLAITRHAITSKTHASASPSSPLSSLTHTATSPQHTRPQAD